MILGEIADGLGRGIESAGASVSGAFEPVLRLGVTGLARAGKTVFITSLVANLLERGRMPQLMAEAEGAIRAAYLQPQPDATVPRFDYENHLATLTGPAPAWPQNTRGISELRLSFRIQSGGLVSGLRGPRRVHLDIVDYPGEWLLDLGLLGKSYAEWSDLALGRAGARGEGAGYLATLGAADPSAPHDEAAAQALARAYTGYLEAARGAGYADCTPGRFLLPGDLAGAPVVTFAPLPRPENPARGSLWREMERRYDAYLREVVKPFFRDHFARIDRQVVLVDLLEAIHCGPRALEDLRQGMAEILTAFRPGRNSLLQRLLLGRRVERILFAATKADHLHHSQHPRMANIMAALLAEAKSRADYAGAHTAAMAIAALRATTEDEVTHQGRARQVVRGWAADGRRVAFDPGRLPDDPARLLSAARQGADSWLGEDFGQIGFAPPPDSLRPGSGPPHIRLDRAAQFLIGDRL